MDEPKIQVKRFEPGNFDDNGNVTNDGVKQDISKFLQAFVGFIQKHKK